VGNHSTSKKNDNVKVCYILAYYFPGYPRTTTLIEALSTLPTLTLFLAINKQVNFLRYIETLYKLLIIRIFKNPEYYILGFRGYEIFFPVRAITFNKHLIFDHMMSPYDSLVNEKRKIARGGFFDFLIYHYEKLILSKSDTIITDTPSHRQYFCKLFNLSPDKIVVIPVGADLDLFENQNGNTTKQSLSDCYRRFEILFYGSFLPLHGIEIILQAAALTKLYPIHFTFIGGNKTKLNDFFAKINELGLTNISHIRWVDKTQLPKHIKNSDIVLGGPFGNTGQANRVITGKTFQALAMGKAAIIGQTENNYFSDKKNCLLVQQGCAKSLATAIEWAYTHKDKLDNIGKEGRKLFMENFSSKCIGDALSPIFSL
jgi:glycosyltransferase involved in cell wall biosynthesis